MERRSRPRRRQADRVRSLRREIEEFRRAIRQAKATLRESGVVEKRRVDKLLVALRAEVARLELKLKLARVTDARGQRTRATADPSILSRRTDNRTAHL